MATVSGKAQQWQRLTLDFKGPQASETAKTFTDHRLDVTFTNSQTGQTLIVPGFFAADGNAANTGATSGNVWRVHFNPPDDGTWTYKASFRTGTNVAASTNPSVGTGASFNGESGSFSVAPAATTGSEFRTDGMLTQRGHYYVHKGNGEVWIKGGSDSPENFLGYQEFDNTFDYTGGALKSWSAHQQDYNTGDPTWAGGRGSEIIGAVNYLSERGVNSQYMILMNVQGDGKDVWPWVSNTTADRTTYDISRLAQWEIVFEHMDNKDVAQHLLLQETENDQLLGGMSTERAVYYREMAARFGHHNGITWNMGEENTNTDAERKAFMKFFKDVDPYDHPVVLHTYPADVAKAYDPLLGNQPMDGVSLQMTDNTRATALKYLANSKAKGDPWLFNWDETGPASTGVLPDNASGADANHDTVRTKMWGLFTAGASGVEHYFGGGAEGDLNNQNFRVREKVWEWTQAGRKFFEALPVHDMKAMDSLTPQTDFVFADPGNTYAIYQAIGGAASLNLSGQSGEYTVQWYNPRTGVFVNSPVTKVKGGGIVGLGSAPNSDDWAILVKKAGGTSTPPAEELPPSPQEEEPTIPPPTGLTPIRGTTGSDDLKGTTANEEFTALAGSDRMTAGDGNDVMKGGVGNDVYFIDKGTATVVENVNEGRDVVNAWASYTLTTNVEELLLRGAAAISGTGNALANKIVGQTGANTLEGEGGNDTLIGYNGGDQLWGGSGADTFDFRALSHVIDDVIMDFTKGDKIMVNTIDANSGVTGNQNFSFRATPGGAGSLWVTEENGDTFVHLNTGSTTASLQLAGIGHALAASDLVL